MDFKERELKIWHDLLDHEARRECATDHWSGELLGHAKAMRRMSVIDDEELCELLELADAAFSHVNEELETRRWLEEQRGMEEGEGRQDAGDGGEFFPQNSG